MATSKLMPLFAMSILLGFAETGASAPAATSGAAGPIKQAVLSRQVRPLSSAPVDVTDKFPSKQGSIWAVMALSNAPHDTRVRAVLATVDVGKAAPPNTKVSENSGTYDGSRYVGFNWGYSMLPAGTYKVDVYLNDKLDRTLNLSIADQVPAISPPKAGAIGSCPKLPPRNPAPPGFPISVTIAQGRDSAGNAVNPGRIFRPDSPAFYAVLSTQNAPANTRISAKWFGADTGGLDACNTEFAHYDVSAAGSAHPWFAANPPINGEKWPEGLYRVEIYVNDRLAFDSDFGVCDGSCKFQVPAAWKLP